MIVSEMSSGFLIVNDSICKSFTLSVWNVDSVRIKLALQVPRILLMNPLQ
jgi:hypothetical protein